MAGPHLHHRDEGFSLVEVLVSTSVVIVLALGLAQLFAMALAANSAARRGTLAVALATQKMEQMRALPWGYDEAAGGIEAGLGSRVSDESTDLGVDPLAPGGIGLSQSPPDALFRNSPPAVDFLDADGRWVGTGTDPPRGTIYVRRWAVEPLPADPANTLVLQVLVTTTLRGDGRRPGGARAPGDVWLVSAKTRKAR